MSTARIHDKYKLRSFWEQRIVQHSEQVGGEEARRGGSALTRSGASVTGEEERRRRLRDDLDKTVLRLALTESEASDSERVKSTSKRLTSESLQSRLGAIERSELLRIIDEQDERERQDAEYQEEQKRRFNEKRDEQKSGGSDSEGSQGQERAYQKEAAALRRVEVEGEWESRSEGGSKRDRQTMSRDRTERGWHSDSTAGPKDESRDSPFHGRQAQTRHHSASKGGASGDEDDIKTPDRGDTGHKSSEYETFQPPRADRLYYLYNP
ncbi:hypothetical protein KUDE01_021762 [Dissostichus eleginoides]|uniref:Uncharacterized protein n=1 Tax=Dissostichus eleginoides TaxID=100907 RepID=A0AAD9BKK0_DISEL|nr:hypothetical protein KUDE01_021762 [Dissostichus eleginoides]